MSLRNWFAKLRGTRATAFRIGPTGPDLTQSGTDIEFRTPGGALAVARAANGVGATDLATVAQIVPGPAGPAGAAGAAGATGPTGPAGMLVELVETVGDFTDGSSAVPDLNPGNFTTGQKYLAMGPPPILGIRFYWAGGGGALVVRCSLYVTSQAGAVASVDVAVNAAGVYEGLFAAPYAIAGMDSHKYIWSAVWETSGTSYTGGPNNFSVAMPAPPFSAGPGLMFTAWRYGAAGGDIKPDTSPGTEKYYVDLMVLCFSKDCDNPPMALRNWFTKLRGTIAATLRIGLGGPVLTQNGTVIEFRTPGGALTKARGADGVDPTDFVTMAQASVAPGQPGVALVNANGSDVTGAIGTLKPYLTVTAALAALAAAGGRGVMYVGPGDYIVPAGGLAAYGTLSNLAVVGWAGPHETTITGGDEANAVMRVTDLNATLLRLLLISGVRLQPAAVVGTTGLSVGSAASAVHLADGVFLDNVILGGNMDLETCGPLTAFRVLQEAPPDASGIGRTRLRELGGKTTIVDAVIPEMDIQHDYDQPQPAEGQEGYFLRSVKMKKLQVSDSPIVNLDADCAVTGEAGFFANFALRTSTDLAHNPWIQSSARVGDPEGAPRGDVGTDVFTCAWANVYASGGAGIWGLDLTGAQIFGGLRLNVPNIPDSSSYMNPAAQYIGGEGVKISGNVEIQGTAEAIDNWPVQVKFRGIDTSRQESGTYDLTVSGYIDFDVRGGSGLGWWSSMQFSDGAGIDADTRSITVAASVPGSVVIDPPYASYVNSDYSISVETANTAAGLFSYSSKTSDGFDADSTIPAGTTAIYTLTRSSLSQ